MSTERRFKTAFEQEQTDEAGLVIENDGVTYLVAADGSRAPVGASASGGVIELESSLVPEKISDLADGSPLQATDEFVVARGASNVKIPASAVGGSLPDPITTPLTLTPSNKDATPLTIQPEAGGTADDVTLTQWNDDQGNLLAFIDAQGNMTILPAAGVTSAVLLKGGDSAAPNLVQVYSQGVVLQTGADGNLVHIIDHSNTARISVEDGDAVTIDGSALILTGLPGSAGATGQLYVVAGVLHVS